MTGVWKVRGPTTWLETCQGRAGHLWARSLFSQRLFPGDRLYGAQRPCSAPLPARDTPLPSAPPQPCMSPHLGCDTGPEGSCPVGPSVADPQGVPECSTPRMYGAGESGPGGWRGAEGLELGRGWRSRRGHVHAHPHSTSWAGATPGALPLSQRGRRQLCPLPLLPVGPAPSAWASPSTSTHCPAHLAPTSDPLMAPHPSQAKPVPRPPQPPSTSCWPCAPSPPPSSWLTQPSRLRPPTSSLPSP